jgi:serine/threonine-protein kinase
MAPEQLRGEAATVRSDIYALGLILYELFTGKRAFEAGSAAELQRLEESSSPASPSTLVEHLNPAVERAVLRCLEPDPAARPASALAVAAELPGGDPLAAALAAGETPSPEVVAAAGGEGGLRPGLALACLAVVLLGLAVLMLFSEQLLENELLGHAPMEKPPQVLVEDARRILRDMGHASPPADSAFGFGVDDGYLLHIQQTDHTPGRWERLASGQPPAIYFWYRESPRLLVPEQAGNSRVRWADPPLAYSGEVRMDLDSEGRLQWLDVVPPEKDEPEGSAPAPEWSVLFAAAGLEASGFTRTEPAWTPWNYCDRRMAWEGRYPGDPETPIRVEAGAYRGQVTFFRIIGPWSRPGRMEADQGGALHVTIASVLFSVLCLAILARAVLLAVRNLRLGRADRRGATRLALFAGSLRLIQWALGASHVALLGSESQLLWAPVATAVLLGALVWVLYLALEPFLRRRWPESLVSWNRVLAGRLRDPRVGRDILVGGAAVVGCIILLIPVDLLPRWMGWLTPIPRRPGGLEAILGGRQVLAGLLASLWGSVLFAMVYLFAFLLLRILLRRQWLAVAALLLLLAPNEGLRVGWASFLTSFGASLLLFGVMIFLLSRLGLLSVVSFLLFLRLQHVATGAFSAWYGTYLLMFLLAAAAIAVYAFWISWAGRPLLGGELLAED